MEKTLKIVIILCVILGTLSIILFSLFLLNLPNTRGLRITQIWRTNDAWFPTAENQGTETLCIKRFYTENGTEINTAVVDRTNFWNGTCYVLPKEKFMTLILTGELYNSKQIFVEFTDGCKAKIYG